MMQAIKHRLAYFPKTTNPRYAKAAIVLGLVTYVVAAVDPYTVGMMAQMAYSGTFMLVGGGWIWWAHRYRQRTEEQQTVDETETGVDEEWQCPECDGWNYLYHVEDDTAYCSHCSEGVPKDADVTTRRRSA